MLEFPKVESAIETNAQAVYSDNQTMPIEGPPHECAMPDASDLIASTIFQAHR